MDWLPRHNHVISLIYYKQNYAKYIKLIAGKLNIGSTVNRTLLYLRIHIKYTYNNRT